MSFFSAIVNAEKLRGRYEVALRLGQRLVRYNNLIFENFKQTRRASKVPLSGIQDVSRFDPLSQKDSQPHFRQLQFI